MNKLLSKIIEYILGDLPISNGTWFKNLFYDRENEANSLIEYLETCRKTGNNILLVGRRGVGKSTLRRKVEENNYCEKLGFKKYVLDLQEIDYDPDDIKENLLSVLKRLNKALRAYLSSFNVNLQGYPKVRDEYSEICEKLKDVETDEENKEAQKLLLVIDDIDYTETDFQKRLLGLLRPLFCSKMVIIFYAVRPEAERTARGHYDTTLNNVFRQISWLYIHPLRSSGLLPARMKYITNSSLLSEIVSIFSPKNDESDDEFNNHKSETKPELYPFTRNQEIFIDCISNGSSKYILESAKHIYSYIKLNKDRLQKNGDGKYVVGLDKMLDVFDISKVKESEISIIDIASATEKSSKGYSLLYSVLEYVFSNGKYPGDFHAFMKKRGFSHESANSALSRCLLEYDLIEKDFFDIHAAVGHDVPKISKYQLTPKGRYYILYLTRQPEYLRKFGIIKRSIHTYQVNDRLYQYLFEFLRRFYNSGKEYFMDGVMKVNKQRLFKLFLQLNPDVHNNIDETTPETPALSLKLDIYGFSELLTSMNESLNSSSKDTEALFSMAKVKKKEQHFTFYESRVKKLIQQKYGEEKLDEDFYPILRYREFFEYEFKLSKNE
jgi:hypothetical protein